MGKQENQYNGNIHKFSHLMNTQDGVVNVTLSDFDDLAAFLQHLPAQTTLIKVEDIASAENLST